MKALLVEDDVTVRALVEEILRMRGHEVTSCADAEAAWEAHGQDAYPLILIDWHLPGMSGLELCRRLRALPDAARGEILILTASMEPRGLEMALDVGADDYLQKPFSLDLLDVRLTIAERRVAATLERLRAEETLLSSEEQYRTMTDTVADGIITIDDASHILAVNPAAARIFGYSDANQELLGQSVTMLLPERLRQRHLEVMATYVTTGTGLPTGRGVEFMALHKDGREIPMELSLNVAMRHGTRLYTAILRDITARKHAEEERAELLHRAQEARALAEEAAARISRLHAVTAALSSALTPEEVANVIVHEGTATLGADGGFLVLLKEAGTTLEVMATSGYPADLVDAYRRFPLDADLPLAEAVRTGQPVWVPSFDQYAASYRQAGPTAFRTAAQAAAFVPLLVQGRPLGGLTLSFTTPRAFGESDRRYILALAEQCAQALQRADLFAAEKAARAQVEHLARERSAILSQLTEGIVVADAAGVITFVNEAARRLLGGATLGVPVASYVNTYHLLTREGVPYPPHDLPLARAAIRRETVVDASWRIRRPDGSQVIIQGSAAPIEGDDGAPHGAVLTMHDITDRARLDDDRAQLLAREHEVAEQLRQMERWRSAFLRIMAHEVRTPLGQVVGFSDLLATEAERLSSRGQRFLANIQEAAAGMQTLVERSLDLLSLYAGEVRLEHAPVAMHPLVQMALTTHRAAAEAKEVVLRLGEVHEQPVVYGDGQRLRQVLDVLLDNAIAFTPSGGTVDVTVDRRGDLAAVAVQDSGPGVPPEMRAYIFGGQAEEVMTRRHGGGGLSLVLARRITDLHGGRLDLEESPHGARFVLTLPATDGEVAPS